MNTINRHRKHDIAKASKLHTSSSSAPVNLAPHHQPQTEWVSEMFEGNDSDASGNTDVEMGDDDDFNEGTYYSLSSDSDMPFVKLRPRSRNLPEESTDFSSDDDNAGTVEGLTNLSHDPLFVPRESMIEPDSDSDEALL